MSGTTLPLAPDASRGRSLGKYEVLSRLSTGGMAEIFLASQRGLAGFRKLVVLKQILPDIRGEEEFIRMFLDEAKVTAAFNHPHIAQVFDLDIAEGELFLAMEFVPGATLVEVARACRQANHPIPMGFSLMAVRDTAVALHYAHTFTDPLGHPSPVIHRDVAEKNIMVTYEGVTKLLDFGIAKSLARASRTAVGMVKGTSGYMSPEQIMGDPLDARSDLFSLGVVLHELLTGMRLFYAKQAEAMMNAVLKCEVTPPSRSNKQIPPELDAIVLRALSRRREDRYASTLEFARALERAVGPLIWHPEQSSEVMRRLFADRREQTRQLLIAGPASGDVTGETNVAQMLAMGGSPPTAPDVPEPPTVNTTSGPPDSAPMPRRASGTIPTVKSSGPQSSAQPTPRRATTTALPTTPPPPPPPDPEPPRKAVLRAPPQKKLGSRGAGQEPSRPPPPSETLPSRPPDDETHTARTQPGRPALTSPGPARTPPPPPPAALTTSGPTRSAAPSPGPARTPPPPPSRPSAGDDTTLRNDSRPRSGRTMEAPRAQVPAPMPPARNEETAMVRVASLSSSDSGPSRRAPAPRRRTQAQLPASLQTPDPNLEATTKPARSFQENRRTPPLAEAEDNDSHVHTLNGVSAARSRVGLKVLATVLVLLAVGTAVVGLGLDGGVVSNRVRPLLGLAPRVTPLPPEQVKKPAPAPKVESAPTQGALAGRPVEPPPEPVGPPASAPEEAAPEAPAETEVADTNTPVSEEKSSPRAKAPRTPNKRAQPRDSAPLATGEPGFLTLSTEPQAQVFLGGQLLGETPLFKVNVPSGKHTLKLVDEEGRALKLTVEIKPGDTTSMRVPLEMLSRQ
ncbi:serine/threonine-protein kinase [Myxococcus sp. AS-1-15]|uniref:serine/threonine-protein kinase n=1 Tax=Myxococcus sp. AS-1-15 TaxID=2874600 RepID=UPI002105D126|nr:serine/threonine-protein kinase [Myxococcus sp. AS-1-15]MBZ4399176.1 protein kinase [Myxococcus sp. AS-1-15]